MHRITARPLVLAATIIAFTLSLDLGAQGARSYQELLKLWADFVAFERPPLKDGAPDYTAATVAARRATLKTFQSRLTALETAGRPFHRVPKAACQAGRSDLQSRRDSARACRERGSESRDPRHR